MTGDHHSNSHSLSKNKEMKCNDLCSYSFKQSDGNTAESSVILFPGQGSQIVGMGKELLKCPGAVDVFQAANEILGYDILDICLNGPQERLDKTIHCQPAMVVCSLAAVEKLKQENPTAIENCIATSGFSLGEITALVFAGSFDFSTALELVKVRADEMQKVCESASTGMMVVWSDATSDVPEACKKAKEWCLKCGIQDPVCSTANYLFPYCEVVAGHTEALDFIEKNSYQFNLKKVKRKTLSGAFHTSVMKPVAKPFREVLEKADIRDPLIPVYSSMDGKPYENAEHIIRQLPEQIIAPVQWEQVLHNIYDDKPEGSMPQTYECGPGVALRIALKKVNTKAWESSISVKC